MTSFKEVKRAKRERKAMYMDIILGTISAVLSLIGIIYFGIVEEVKNWVGYIVGLTFWICWLIFSCFLIGVGIYLWYQEKYFEEKEPRKDLKAPIV